MALMEDMQWASSLICIYLCTILIEVIFLRPTLDGETEVQRVYLAILNHINQGLSYDCIPILSHFKAQELLMTTLW